MKKNSKKFHLSKKIIVGLSLMIIGFSGIFFSGSFSKDTEYEKIAHYASKVVTDNTVNKKYCSLTVESTKDSGSILNHHSEFYNLYGSFRQTKITFGSMVNLYHDYNIFFDEIESNNLSIFYLGPNGSEEYNGHYKHYIYPFELMFPSSANSNEFNIVISQSQAKRLLIYKNDYSIINDDFSEEAYKSLLGTKIPISIDGVINHFNIQNIFYESNYYYEGINEIAGEFILCINSLPNGLMSNLKNIYFLSEYDYQNAYFMKYINKGYGNHKYLVRVNHNNITGDINDAYLVSFYQDNNITNTLSYFLLTISTIAILSSLVLFWFEREPLFYSNFLIFLFSIIPYTVFWVIFKMSSDITFFSGFSTKINMFALLIFYFLYALLVKRKCYLKQYDGEKKFDEIDI